jgi:ribosomal protein S18 acetylase RimI-like enzyme
MVTRHDMPKMASHKKGGSQMQSNSSAYDIRSGASQADLPGLARLYAADETEDQDIIDRHIARLGEQMALPGLDRARDQWVELPSADAEEFIGYCLIWLPPDASKAHIIGIVHPAWRRQGIGSALLDHALARARELGATSTAITARNAAAEAFCKGNDFHEVGAYTRFRADAPFVVAAPDWSASYQVRSYDTIGQPAVLAQAMTGSYHGLWGHHVASEQDIIAWLPEMTPAGIFVIFAPDGSIAGVCRSEMRDNGGVPEGYIDAPGIMLSLRHPDLYRALFLTALSWLAAQHPASIELESWGDDPAVLRIYQEHGFVVSERLPGLEREL